MYTTILSFLLALEAFAICTDAASSKPMVERTFGQFARVLVDMDVT